MKKIDFHVHTVPAPKEADFTFDIEVLKTYVNNRKLDAIAITNHNHFDIMQFKLIERSLDIDVFPGIELDVEGGHLLLISDLQNIEDFSSKCSNIETCFTSLKSSVGYEDVHRKFGDLSQYLIIPHFDKKPKITDETINKFQNNIICGEVSNAKKFVRMKKKEGLTPVLFSDIRIDKDLSSFPLSQTYIELDDMSLPFLKECLKDKTKVFLNRNKMKDIFEILDDGTVASTGLTVICGKRSSGKSYTLDRINENFDNVKYIEQFGLIETNKKVAEKDFKDMMSKEKILVAQNYLAEFKSVVEEILEINQNENETNFVEYVSSLQEVANDSEKRDVFAKTKMFDEQPFIIKTTNNIEKLIVNIEAVIVNKSYSETIKKHINIDSLKKLIIDLISIYREEKQDINLMKRINNIISKTKNELRRQSSASSIIDFNLVDYIKEKLMIERFCELANLIKQSKTFYSEKLFDYDLVAKKRMIRNATEIKKIIGRTGKYKPAFDLYDKPYEYAMKLKEYDHIANDHIYKCFSYIDYNVKNKYGFNVSGGERAEFNLEKKLFDANNFDMLLIDEPESSFDNIFLNESINNRIKLLSNHMPVIVVTHNNSVGASIKPDYILYTERIVDTKDLTTQYRVYGGNSICNELTDVDGNRIENYTITMDCFEAGESAYEERGNTYENIKNQ